MAQQFGIAALFGIAAQETGLILETSGYNFEQESKPIRNITGDTTGKTYFDERFSASFSGYIPTSGGFSTTLASTITLVTTPTDYFSGSVGTTTIVESVSLSNTVDDYRRIEISAMHHPLIV
jgi:hypothetical protein